MSWWGGPPARKTMMTALCERPKPADRLGSKQLGQRQSRRRQARRASENHAEKVPSQKPTLRLAPLWSA